jgi:hypothetical protein
MRIFERGMHTGDHAAIAPRRSTALHFARSRRTRALADMAHALPSLHDMSNATPRIAACAIAALLLAALPASAQIVIKGDDDVNFRLGVLGQFQADTITNPDPESNTNNLFARRLRLLFGGQVARNVTFFIETDAPNLGKTLSGVKDIQPPVLVQDAYAEVRFTDALMLDAGLMFIPFSRNGLQSAGTLLPIDYGAYTFSDSAPTQSTTGRDTGFQARGYLAGNRLEYRIGAFQGVRDAGSDNAFRYAGRVQYNALDPESGFFYTGTYLGKKKILAVGAAFDMQQDFHGYDADAFFDHPLGPGAVTAQFDYNHYDGGTTLTTLPKQNDVLFEAGYLIRAAKLTPVLQIAHQNLSDQSLADTTRVAAGANYWWAGHNSNVKALYTRVAPTGLARQNEFTVQLQVFLY